MSRPGRHLAPEIKIVVSDQQALGTYANFASIVHNFAEFIPESWKNAPCAPPPATGAGT